ncbi:peptidoglycan endopeptidase RipA [Mycolicibacterium madagascariense]|uniref:Peptidoglycan endopeptidase RipA n=1 Tax=Mycolicibacterium madagascariense TaxID=212765 RepID=A0A7I7XGK1_9MYCO|nr:NlpC/P60 family peptidoglycan endopeptidase RipA [Mycolicibacterium madagascariense]MCV7013282.1 NlpC/P60 family peptidoglycan endopeptidase RipA [Mycolicibacterium madagascariense]BBZ28334.1 peptidoglycan endopeptidase RipA [Mycolicibacterium madagascariense]
MRRTLRASVASSLACGVLVTTVFTYGVGVATADPVGPQGIAGLVAAVANADQKLQDLGARIQSEQEGVNKAIVAVQTARDDAAAAQAQVQTSQAKLADADAAIAAAQTHFDAFAASNYVNGPSASYVTAKDPADILDTAAVGQTLNVSTQQAITDLQRARTERVNEESAARAAKQKADQALLDAQSSQDAAVASLTQAQQTFKDQQAQLDQLTAERSAAQAELAAARDWSTPATGVAPQAAPQAAAAAPGNPAANWDRDPSAAAPGNSRWDTGWDPTLPAIPSAFVSGDPVAILNGVLGIASTSSQLTSQMGHSFLQKLGLVPTDSGFTNGAIPRVYGRQASEYVIRRAGSQIGVPYSWGGGTAAGPSRGIDSGAGTTGFDCSGLILYAFAGVGIRLPHYSGAQYDMGRKIPASQMRRGDVIFYGPGGAQHVTLYLGAGKMLEAPYTGSDVHISDVRTSGMTPYVVRYIEY